MKGLLYTFQVSKNSMVVFVIVLNAILSLSEAKTDGVCEAGKFGPLCQYFCNCELSCDQITGACSMCKPGWYGPNCQMNNVALNKAARLRKFPTEMAKQLVDGDKENTCLSVSGVDTQRLKIDLGAQVTLHHVTIFDVPGRDPSEREWSKGLSIVLGNTTVLKTGEYCHNHTEAFPKDGVLDIVCSIRGQHLYLIKKNKPKELRICEVEAYVCADKTWGVECENLCGNCKDGTTCDQFTGVCPDGCNIGWYGNSCNIDNKFKEFANVDSGSTTTSSGTTTNMASSVTTDLSTEITTETTAGMSSTETTKSATSTQGTTGVTTGIKSTTSSMSSTGTSEVTTTSSSGTTKVTTTVGGTTVSVSSPETTTDTMTVSSQTPEVTSETVSTTVTLTSSTTPQASTEINTSMGTPISTTSSTTMAGTTTSTGTTEVTTMPDATIATASTKTTEHVSSTDGTTVSTLSTEYTTETVSLSSLGTTHSQGTTTVNMGTGGTTTAATSTGGTITVPTSTGGTITAATGTGGTTTATTSTGGTITATTSTGETTKATTSTGGITVTNGTEGTTEVTTVTEGTTEVTTVTEGTTEVTTVTEGTTGAHTSSQSSTAASTASESTVSLNTSTKDTSVTTSTASATTGTEGTFKVSTVTEGTTTATTSTERTASVTTGTEETATTSTSPEGTDKVSTVTEGTTTATTGTERTVSVTTGTEETATNTTVTEGTVIISTGTDKTASVTTSTEGTAIPTDQTEVTAIVSTGTNRTGSVTTGDVETTAAVTMSTEGLTKVFTSSSNQTTEGMEVTTTIQAVTMTTQSKETTAVTTNGSGPVPAEEQVEAAVIAMSVIIPIALIIIIVALVFVILKKKKRKSADLQHKICLNEWRVTKPDGTVSVINETTSLTSESCNNILASLSNVDKETTSLTSRKNSQGSLGSLGTKDGSMASLSSPVYTNVSTKKAIPINKLHRYIVTMQAKKGFEKEYKALPAGMVLPHKDGLMEENRSKNRYINMISYDHSRVYIDKEDGDYINANYIDGFIRRNAYIATQGPTRNTTEDFWHMIWQEEVGKIVMLTNLIESNKVKCYKYWPSEDSDLLFNSLQITLNSEEIFPPFVIRKISLIDVEMNETRNITQFHYTSWPDHGVPEPFSIMTFHRKIQQFTSSLSGPMVVHCSAGIGRTGTLIAIDSLFKQGEASYYLSINQFVRDMRQNRVNMVQTLSQYTFIHSTLLEMFACNKDPVIQRDVFYQVWADPEFKDKVHDEYLSLMALRPEFDDLDYSIGRDPVNIDKHRDPRIMAVDKYRAYLQSYSVSRTDYINAVMLPSHYQQQGYILSQFPLQSTVIDLWQMLYDYQSNTVVIVDVLHFDEQDSGVFWPAIGEKLTLGAFVIHCVAQAGTRDMTFNLSNKYSKKSMDVRVLIGAGWSENQDVPSDADYWFELHNDIQKWQETQGQRPITVLCRDGGSRGALCCAISNVIDGLDIYKDVDVFHVFRQIHNHKPEVLDLKEQYEHCYEVARLYLDAGSLYSS